MTADDLVFDDEGYPTEETLAVIRTWEPPFEPLFDRLGQLWRWSEWGFRRHAVRRRPWKGAPTLERRYDISTGGWSGHEDVIGAMQDNMMLWALCWEQSRRGGHYIFRVPS